MSKYFNPRSPHGERQMQNEAIKATVISIHAPRMGSDEASPYIGSSVLYFNPRSPHGERPKMSRGEILIMTFQSTLPAWGATLYQYLRRHLDSISIHAPRMGSDRTPHHLLRRDRISIHAPRMGSDVKLLLFLQVLVNFNPRSPHGERRTTSRFLPKP